MRKNLMFFGTLQKVSFDTLDFVLLATPARTTDKIRLYQFDCFS